MDWKWQSFGEGWRRTSFVEPGYDCRVECQHKVKGDHGICADGWCYVVSTGECAGMLFVRSANYPSTVDTSRHEAFMRRPSGSDLTLHVSWPAASDEDDTREAVRLHQGRDCALVDGGRCWNPKSTALGAKEFWDAHGSPDGFDQPESFWEALREKATAWIADAKAMRARLAHVRQCPACQGRGVVEIKEEKR